MFPKFQGTTIIAVRKSEDDIAIGGDGQVSLGETIMKMHAKKIRKLYHGKVLAGFAGAVADALTLFERFESKIEEYKGNLQRAAVELTKDWRTDKYLRRLEALLIAVDKKNCLVISGTGEVIEPDDDIAAIGSGSGYALAAARALLKYTNLSAKEIVEISIKIAASICVHTNDQVIIETL
jgi:ATP-dependent HslUV protease subunit HslV